MEINKLVRDKMPQIYKEQGQRCEVEKLDMQDYAEKLLDVLDEEIEQFKQLFVAEDDEQSVKKIADVVDVLYAVLDLIGVEKSAFEKIRQANFSKYGGFEGRTLLKTLQ